MTQGTDGFYYQYSTKYEVVEKEEEEVGRYRLNINPVDMTGSRTGFPFCYADPDCMSSFWEIIVSANHTNVIAYEAQVDGQIKIDSLNLKINGEVTGREIEFAVADKDGVILTNNGRVKTLNASASSVTGITMGAKEIKSGEKIYFVFHGNSGSVNSIECTASVLFSADGESWNLVNNATGKLWATSTDNTTQGTDGFYYQYSTEYKKLAFSAEGIDASYNFDRYIQPYWEGTTVYNESVWVPEHWNSLQFNLLWQGVRLNIVITNDGVKVTSDDNAQKIKVTVNKEAYRIGE